MTTPDVRGLSEEIGILELYGASISTFTRTISLALHHLEVPFVFRHHLPHSAEIKAHNPLGLVPVLIHRPDAVYAPKDSLVLYESNAIRRYIDDAIWSTASVKKPGLPQLNPQLNVNDSRSLHKTAGLRANVDQIVSLASTTVFTALEGRIIKPRQSLEQNGADEGTIGVALEEAMGSGRLVVKLLEGFLRDNKEVNGAKGDWFIGDAITWADLYLYPIFADLLSIPEGPKLLQETPLLDAWVKRMEGTQIAKATYPGSVPDLRKQQK